MRHQKQTTQPIKAQFRAYTHHTQSFYKTIEDFFQFANPCDCKEVNNEFLSTFLERVVDDPCLDDNHIETMVFMNKFQTKFLADLKNQWEQYKRVTNLKIEKI